MVSLTRSVSTSPLRPSSASSRSVRAQVEPSSCATRRTCAARPSRASRKRTWRASSLVGWVMGRPCTYTESLSSFLQTVVLRSGEETLLELRQGDKGLAPVGGEPGACSFTEARQVPERALVCAACGHPTTDEAARIEMAGCHAHTCVNPGGYVYRIGCFRHAPGVVGAGGWSGDYSWFGGYLWQVVCCGACSMHLGWAFEPEARSAGTADRFFGLILDRLAAANSPK